MAYGKSAVMTAARATHRSQIPMADPASPGADLAISSQVARGSVGLRAAGFAMERLGLPVWKVPTIWMPWHPGHAKTLGVPPRTPMDEVAFADGITALTTAPVAGEIAAVLTGYFASVGQVEATAAAIDRLRETNSDLLVVCDPVSADSHGAYVPQSVIDAVRADLLPRASLVTPNRFELALLAGDGSSPTSNADLMALAADLRCRHTIVTSAFGLMREATGTLLVTETTALLAEHSIVPGAPHGTGDLLSALLTAHLVQGRPLAEAMERATASVFDMVVRSTKRGTGDLALAQEQASLVSPMAMVHCRQLARPKLTA